MPQLMPTGLGPDRGRESRLTLLPQDGGKGWGEIPMYTASDLRKGLKVIIDDEPYIVTAFDFSKPGKGQALYRTKLRNMITGLTIDRT